MKITFDIDVGRKKSIVNFEFTEKEDNIIGYNVCREALGMMYTELGIKLFPNQDYVHMESGMYCAKLGFPPSDMPEEIVAEIKEMDLVTTEIKSFFCNETLKVIAHRKEIVTLTDNAFNKFIEAMGVNDEQNERE